MAAKSPKNVQATAPEQTANLPVPFEEITEAKAVELGPLLYTEPGALKPYLDHIKASVNEVPDLTTTKGRDRIASLAASVSRSKGVVEKPCRAYLKHLKAVVKPIEQNIKEFVDECDALRDKTREPLTKWEEEQKAILARLKAKVDYFGEEYQSMLENMPSNLHERADFIKAVLDDIKAEPVGDDFESMKEAGEAAKADVISKMTLAYQAAIIESDNQRKADAQAEQERLAREKQIAEEAAAKAKADAEAAAQAKIDAANAAAQKAIDDAAAEQRQREQQAQQDAANKLRAVQLINQLNSFSMQINEAQDSKAMQQLVSSVSEFNIPDDLGQEFSQVLSAYDVVYCASYAKLGAMLRADEETKKALQVKEEADRKAANVEHRRAINKAIMKQLITLGASEELSKAIITAAVNGELGAMTINY
ncbi:hypothetical protein [Shewanella cutis]|uniref:DUF1351 domain-containing protein n=1 Tax=Shewanella cutis TaxID=2766780 RepID=A0ABS9QW55_9GAMM|nr:hypothetical protein [Shewanella sp. PS-2]MCG9964586.1 hypothetical protein [Shewanella sp. PS-2]